jgi:uncharacterized protein YjbI with pentapeptide repeats
MTISLHPDPAAGASDDPAAALAALRARRDGGEALPAPPAPLSLAGAHLLEEDLAGLDLSGADLSGAELSRSDLTGCRLIGAKLVGAVLHEATLDEAELLGADLSEADLSDASALRAGFGRARLVGLKGFGVKMEGASMTGADLSGADFRTGDLQAVRLMQSTLHGCVFERADLRGADLTEATVDGASFAAADLREARVRGLTGYKSADWIGADIRNVDFCGAWLLRRHALDENFIHEFRNQSPAYEWAYKLWWVTSDCGRSIGRWGAWTVLVAVAFGFLFMTVDIDYGSHETFLSPLYYSVVTFTTLGYGDVLPASAGAQIMALTEVVLGYVSLGGLLSIMANKLARRAD